MNSVTSYLRELYYLRIFVIAILLVTALSYSVYFFLDESSIARLGDEDHLIEWLSSLNFLFSSLICLHLAHSKRNIFFLLLAIAFFLGFGEEISWGQRIFHFRTPDNLHDINVQKEFNFHNIATWEINFLFKVFTLAFGIALPILVYQFKHISKLAQKIKLPVPPVTIGIFFLADWLIFKFFLEFILVDGLTPKYYFALTEIYEFITSFILLTISIYFLLHKRHFREGVDIKDQLTSAQKINLTIIHGTV